MIPSKSFYTVLAAAFLVGGLSLGVFVADAQNAVTHFPLDKNINVSDEIELNYLDSAGQWFSLTPNVLESFGAGLFRALSEGYGKARIVTPDDGPRETVVGVIDPNKPSGSQYEVRLVNRHPIYTWADAKFNHAHGVSPFYNIDYIPGNAGSGHFAVIGECADGLDARIGNQLVHSVELEDGGMYIFTESGQFVAKENVCHETMTPRICYEGGGCYVGPKTSLVGNGQFILDAGGAEFGYTPRRSPLLYSVQGNNVSRENRLFFTDWRNPVDPFTEKELLEFRYIAYANGVMVGYAKESLGRQPARIPGFPAVNPTEEKNIFFSVPEFQKLAEISVPTTCETRSCTGGPAITQEAYIPIFGIGEYFVAARPASLHYQINTTQPPYDVYRMPSRQELRDGKRPEKVQTLNTLDFVGPGTGGLGGITFDATNPNRVMIFSASFGGTGTYVIYEAGQNGLENVGSGAFNSNRASPFHGVALSGEYLAYTSCDEVGDNDIFGFRNLRSCQLIVEKNGQPLSVEPLPLDLFSGSNMPGVAISPSGYIMVAAYNLTGIDGENGNLYLYQIGGGTPGGGTQVGFEKTLLEIPVELPYAGVHYQRKRDAIYVNGNFVMSGECGGGIGAEDTPASASSKPSEGGLWVFNESGNFVAEKNVCDETGLINVGVHHHSIGYAALRGGGSSFIVHTNFIELGQSNSVMHYALSGGVLTQTSKKPTTEEIGGNNTPSFTGPHVVAANDGAVAGKIFTVPGFNEAGTFEDGLNGIRPVVALDEFIVATIDKRISGSLLGTLDNYQVFRVANGTLEFVQELTEVKEDLKALDPRIPPIGLYSFDYSTNPKRIAFWNVTNKGNSAKIFIYEKTSSGLRFVKEMNAPWDTTKIFKSLITRQNIFAIAGDTIAFPTTDGKFEVWENGQKVATEQLPPTKSYHDINNITNGSTDRGERTPHVLVISPQRKLLAMNEFGAYLYTISSVAPPVPPPIFPPPGQGAPPGTLPLNGISGTLDLAKGYLLLLQSLFGKQTITPISNPPIQAGTSTQFQSIFQQAADIINTY